MGGGGEQGGEGLCDSSSRALMHILPLRSAPPTLGCAPPCTGKDLRTALDAVLAGKPVPKAKPSIGWCAVGTRDGRNTLHLAAACRVLSVAHSYAQPPLCPPAGDLTPLIPALTRTAT
jgi:hypothetical protein